MVSNADKPVVSALTVTEWEAAGVGRLIVSEPVCDEGVGVAVADAVIGFEVGDEFHVFAGASGSVGDDGHPMIDWFAVGAFDRGEV